LRIAVVLTYPIYHDSSALTLQEWLKAPDRERSLAALMASMGHTVELWAAGSCQETFVSEEPVPGNRSYTLRVFPADRKGGKTKYHPSRELVRHARRSEGAFYLLKGVDGGVGTRLLREVLLEGHGRRRLPFGFIIGGDYYSGYVPFADIVFCETEAQKKKLVSPGWRIWRKRVREQSLIRLPKWIDTDLFHPIEGTRKDWDILVAGRLISGWKNYEALGPLTRRFRVAVAGDGPEAPRLRAGYPGARFLGRIPNRELPAFLNRARLFVHTGFRDHYPRVVVEAMACGIPCVAFADALVPEVLPPDCGLLIESHKKRGADFVRPIEDLLKPGNQARRLSMGRRAREHVLASTGRDACLRAVEEMFRRLERRGR
jgi:glycosyltransferase involved in cell wall biosynthesis